jgi:hypothetical protein
MTREGHEGQQIHQRLVKLAQANGLAAGSRMRVDTTVVETKGSTEPLYQPSGGTGEAVLRRDRRRTKRARNVLQQLVLEGMRQELDAVILPDRQRTGTPAHWRRLRLGVG